MKTLLVVNGAMGVGKSAVCRALLEKVQPAAWVDGDWAWMIAPFEVTSENVALAEGNIRHLLQGYLDHPRIDTVILSWVLHRPEMLENLLRPIQQPPYRVRQVTLTLRPEELTERLERDIASGVRTPDIVERALQRLEECSRLDTVKVNAARPVSTIADEIIGLIS